MFLSVPIRSFIAVRIPRMLVQRSFNTSMTLGYAKPPTKVTMGDPIEHATGLEKRELLAKLAGNCDPYNNESCKVGTGKLDDPIQVKSAFDSRLVGCICNEEANVPNWMWLHLNECKRCECGRWFTLIPADPL